MENNFKMSLYNNGKAARRARDISMDELYWLVKEDEGLKMKTREIRSLHAQWQEVKAAWDSMCADEFCSQEERDAVRDEKVKLEKEVKEKKPGLPVITAHGYFPEGRKDKDPHTFYNTILTDIDHITKEQIDELMPRIKKLPFVVFACRSVRGGGIHILSRVEVKDGINDDNFKDVWVKTTLIVEGRLNVEADESVKSISQCMFLNHDAEAYYNPDAIPFDLNPYFKLKNFSDNFFKLNNI